MTYKTDLLNQPFYFLDNSPTLQTQANLASSTNTSLQSLTDKVSSLVQEHLSPGFDASLLYNDHPLPDRSLSTIDPTIPTTNSSCGLSDKLTPRPQSPLYLPSSPGFETSLLHKEHPLPTPFQLQSFNSSSVSSSSSLAGRLTPLPQQHDFINRNSPPLSPIDTFFNNPIDLPESQKPIQDSRFLMSCLIQHPKKNFKQISEIPSVLLAKSFIKKTYLRLKKEFKANPDIFVEKYKNNEDLSEENIKKLFENANPRHRRAALALKRRQNLLISLIQNPSSTYAQIAQLDSVSHTESSIQSTFSSLKKEFNANPVSFVEKYKNNEDLSEENIKKLFENAKPRQRKAAATLKKQQSLLTAFIQHPTKTYAQIAQLDSVSHTESSIQSTFSSLKKEFNANPDIFVENYKNNEDLSEENIKKLFENAKPRQRKAAATLKKQQSLLTAFIQHPTKTYAQIAQLEFVPFSESAAKNAFFLLKKEFNANPVSFVEKYKNNKVLSEENIKKLFENAKPRQRKAAATLKKQQSLLTAFIQHPTKTYAQIVQLEFVPFSESAAKNAFFLLKKEFNANPVSFVGKYKNNKVLSEENIKKLFENAKPRQGQAAEALKRRQNLLISLIQNPTMSQQQISNLPSVPYTVRSIQNTLLLLKDIYKQNPKSFINEYKIDGVLSEQSIQGFLE